MKITDNNTSIMLSVTARHCVTYQVNSITELKNNSTSYCTGTLYISKLLKYNEYWKLVIIQYVSVSYTGLNCVKLLQTVNDAASRVISAVIFMTDTAA